jgi:FdhE protein
MAAVKHISLNSIDMNKPQGDEFITLSKKGKALKTRWPIYGEVIDWMVALLVETIRVEGQAQFPEKEVSTALERYEANQGKSLFQAEKIPVDMELTRRTYRKLARRTVGYLGKAAAGLENVLPEQGSEKLSAIEAALKPESPALVPMREKYGIEPEAFKLLLRLAMRPSLRQLSWTVTARVDLHKWLFGHCPLCGASPALASLRGQGEKRALHCSLCETSWAYPRLRCPFCENLDLSDLSYFYAEGEDGLRMDVCQRCGLRLKTVDLSYFPGPVIPVLDNLATSHLEMATETNCPARFNGSP